MLLRQLADMGFVVEIFESAEIRCAESIEYVHRLRKMESRIPSGAIETFICV